MSEDIVLLDKFLSTNLVPGTISGNMAVPASIRPGQLLRSFPRLPVQFSQLE
jgi:hypothetical protein